MGRSAWALLLALGMHIIFLGMIVPGTMQHPPLLHGARRITVNIERIRPVLTVPVRQKTVPQQPVLVPPTEQESREVPAVHEQTDPIPPPRLTPHGIKQIIPAVVPKNTYLSSDAEGGRRPVNAPPVVPAPEETARAGNTVGPEAAVVEAVPMTGENRPPPYPELARKRGWQGKVVLAVRVLEDGRVEMVTVSRSSSYDLLDEAALEAVRKWRFQPGNRGGKPEAMTVLVPVRFVLRDE